MKATMLLMAAILGLTCFAGDYGEPNPKAPEELKAFSFLIGTFEANARMKRPDGEWLPYKGLWTGRYWMDGYAIADEFRVVRPDGELSTLGTNIRAYNAGSKQWQLRWFDALNPMFADLAPKDLGGVEVKESGVYFTARMMGRVVRIGFEEITKDGFIWRAWPSADGGKTFGDMGHEIVCTRVP